jgi:beta-glucosidase
MVLWDMAAVAEMRLKACRAHLGLWDGNGCNKRTRPGQLCAYWSVAEMQIGFDGLKVSQQPGSANTIVSFRVTNTGKHCGAEVAQLYLGFPPIAEGNEPPLQLKGFRKIMLNPGESKPVELKLDARSFSDWSEKTHAWQIATGTFQIMVGDSSANTPLKTTLTIH